MGTQTGNGGAIAYIPAGPGRPAETIAAARATRGGNIRDSLVRANGGNPLPARARVLTLSAEDLANYGGARGFTREADINDILGAGRVGQRLVNESRGARANLANPAREETRAAQNARGAAAAIARARAGKKVIANEKRRLARQEMGVRRRRQALAALNQRAAALDAIIQRARAR